MKELIFNAINNYYGNDEYCDSMSEEFKDLADYIAKQLTDHYTTHSFEEDANEVLCDMLLEDPVFAGELGKE